MDLDQAKSVMLRTHVAALRHNARANGIYMVSPPGVGKSDGAFQYVCDLVRVTNRPAGLVVFMLATISSVDVKGFLVPIKNTTGGMDSYFSTPPWFPTRKNTIVIVPDSSELSGVRVYREGELPADIALPEQGVLFLDEFGQADDDVKKPAAELIYRGQVGTVRLPDGWRVIAAGNRTSDRSGVVRELMFIVNRRCLVNVEPSMPVWIEWASSQPAHLRPHFLTLSFAQKHPGVVFSDTVPEGTNPFCTPRTLCLLDADLRALRSDADEAADRMPTDAIAREVARGWIGDAAAAQLFTHFRYAAELPDLADIEKSPMSAKMPPNKDAQMVMSFFVAHAMTQQNGAAIMKYISRAHVEMQVLCVNAINKNKASAKFAMDIPEYSQWLIRHKDLLVASRS